MMKPILLQVLTLCALVLPAAASSIIEQQPLSQIEAMAEQENVLKVPGHNNATYGPVPKEDQLFQVEFLEIAPSPIRVDQFFFVFLRGLTPPSKERDVEHLDGLADATLSFTLSVVFSDGEREDPRTYTIPLRTRAYGDAGHISIRDAEGAFVENISSGGRNDIVAEFSIPGVFVKTGTWTFEVEARLGDGTCLFAMSLTQWLEGWPW